MQHRDRFLKIAVAIIALFLGIIALRPFFDPPARALAQSARFDYVHIVSPQYIYKGLQGLLILDLRNANVWFIPRVDNQFKQPVFVVRVPFDQLDQAPQ
jgi:hypothetical protein